MTLSRRDFMGTAVALGASLAWGGRARASRVRWRERRDLHPEGVASGDPDPNSVILWTRRPFEDGQRHVLTLEVSEDEAFRRVVAQARAPVAATADWTTRVLVGGLKPARTYWYRFTDADGNGSRIGRTITAPLDSDPRAVNFAFVSCQDVNEGKLNAFRRMIFEDERAAPENQLGFVLHLGDFIYEVVEYPEEVKTRYDRTIYDVARIPDGGKVANFHYPLTLEGYRAVYKGYLADPDLQDARARWPFVAMWDNHEFSWQGWQSIQKAGKERPGQSIKVAANQAWWEYLPSRCKKSGGASWEHFEAPAELAFGEARIPNPQKDAPPQTILGAEQKAWFKDQLKRATATWKIWGNSQGALDERIDPQNLPPGLLPKPWPAGFANTSPNDYGCAWMERGEIYDLGRDAKITGFAILSGDRHTSWAAYAP